jgi:DNA-binding LytR/AlgR family response regulator
MKLNCLIVDDEPVARDILRDYIVDAGFLELVGEAENPIKAAAQLDSQPIDLMFLDINMPKLSGIEFLRMSKSLPLTIMTTAYSEYALNGYELNVLDYLVKPFSFDRFLKAVYKAKDYYEKTHIVNSNSIEPDYFFVKSDGRIDKIMYADLVCVEAMQNYVVLHTGTEKRIAYLTLKMMEDQLPKSTFVKIHKSAIVNMNKIKSITGKVLNLGSMEAIISQSLYDDVMKEIMKDRLLKR